VELLNVYDCISGGLIKGEIPNVELHYFESMMDYKGQKISQRTYNIFKMHQDFWNVLSQVQGIPPSNQRNIRKMNAERTKLLKQHEAEMAKKDAEL
jgi:uncharacterized protein (DUF3084 family)